MLTTFLFFFVHVYMLYFFVTLLYVQPPWARILVNIQYLYGWVTELAYTFLTFIFLSSVFSSTIISNKFSHSPELFYLFSVYSGLSFVLVFDSYRFSLFPMVFFRPPASAVNGTLEAEVPDGLRSIIPIQFLGLYYEM